MQLRIDIMTAIEEIELETAIPHCPDWSQLDSDNIELPARQAHDLYLPAYWIEAKQQSARRFRPAYAFAWLLFVVALFGSGLAIGHTLASRTDDSDVESESYSRDGLVCLKLGNHEYKFAPNIARAIADDFRQSAEELEGSAE
jgi:hypothetical protein